MSEWVKAVKRSVVVGCGPHFFRKKESGLFFFSFWLSISAKNSPNLIKQYMHTCTHHP